MKFNLNFSYLKIYLMHVFVIFVYMIFSTIFILDQDAFKGFSMDGLHNNFCLEETNHIICKNEYKKKKLFYILMDGISYDNFMNYLKKINII